MVPHLIILFLHYYSTCQSIHAYYYLFSLYFPPLHRRINTLHHPRGGSVSGFALVKGNHADSCVHHIPISPFSSS
ncbi:hypothetical protein BDV27DRAFT_6862 [Aspergillus caelatus]|uniref:Secreted protein n=1 Tax=Aspergillus caelatus TaxID=61420 RepID=A0A5N7A224_9EURO|nr:uncharacterized protein BDV27DRAFT_6862 [Aspergillus caelatus]KAE8363508.1 hypothetical protein BDV27DRAFT_6862 [Aspergillus caelatus]